MCCLKCFCVVPLGEEEGNPSLAGTGHVQMLLFFFSLPLLLFGFFFLSFSKNQLQEAGATAPVPGAGRAEARGGGVGGGQLGCGPLARAPPSPAESHEDS